MFSNLSINTTVLIAAILITGAILFVFRFEVQPANAGASVTRLDRWSGSIDFCAIQAGYKFKCGGDLK